MVQAVAVPDQRQADEDGNDHHTGMVQKGRAVMTLKKHNTTIEARLIAPDVVEIRYVAPHKCDWIKETYNLSTLKKAGWEEVT